MKIWKEITEEYSEYLHSRLEDTQPRLSALSKIGEYIYEVFPELFSGEIELASIDKNQFKSLYISWKGDKLNGAEKQVFNDLYTLYKTR